MRKQVYDLTVADLEAHPVWEHCLDEEGLPDQDEATVRPYPTGGKPLAHDGMLVVRARLALANGTGFTGYLYYVLARDRSPQRRDSGISVHRRKAQRLVLQEARRGDDLMRIRGPRSNFLVASGLSGKNPGRSANQGENNMLKRLVVAGALAAAVLASGCATVDMASTEMDTSAKSYGVKSHKANIYVYRNEVFGAAVKLPVLLNGKAVGDTASKTFMLLEVDPGSHTIVTKAEKDAVLKVDAAAGRNYFVWQEVKMGLWQPASLLHLVDEATGKAGVAECRLIQPNAY